jgi:drug/metabolite transporter (DMT)-like permease
MAWLFLGENIRIYDIIGILSAFIGVLLVNDPLGFADS